MTLPTPTRNEFGGRFTGVTSKLQSDIYDAAHSINGSNVLIDYDKLEAIIAHHTKEAVREECLKARMDENRRARNAMEPNEFEGRPYVPSFDLYTSLRNNELEAELAAPQQSKERSAK